MSSKAPVADPTLARLRSVPLEQFPLLAVRLAPLSGLPRPLTSLIGREADVAAARDLLLSSGARLLTLTGPGGVGKTRLAIRIAGEVATAFPDGVAFVPLASISDPQLVLPAISRELGLQDMRTLSPRERIVDFLHHQRLLLVLDNFEQVREAAPQLAAILEACPDLSMLVTSRAPLRIGGEQRFPVAPLRIGGPSDPSPAVELFAARAQASDPNFALDAANAPAIADICRRLDGLPLAIELAAAQIPMFPPSDLLARLDRALPYLSGGPQDAPYRQRTMRQAIAWSYDLLSDAEQTLLRCLATFSGGFSLEAAEWVEQAAPLSPPRAAPPSIFEAVSALLEHSLVHRIALPNEEPRFAMLEVVREFALDELAKRGEADRVREAHAAYFLDLAERAEPELEGAEWEAWVDRLVRELPNLRAALAFLREREDGERAVRLTGALCLLWTLPDCLREGREWLEMAVALPGSGRARAALAKALNAIAVVAQWQYDFPCIEAALSRALAIRQELGDELGVAEVLGNLGNAALDSGDLDRAEALLAQSLPIYERHDRMYWAGETLILLGHTVRAQGQYEKSAEYHEAAVAVLRQLPGQNKLGDALISLGWAELVRGELARSRAAYREGLAVAEASHDRMRMGRSVGGAAGLAAAGDAPALAARLFGAAAAQRDEEQVQLKPVIQAELDQLTTRVRDALGDSAFITAWEAGQSLQLESAVVEARTVLADDWTPECLNAARRAARAVSGGTQLTRREWEVLRLLAAGRSDKEIAAVLFISSRTASAHVSAIIAKLGVSSRAAAAVIAARDLLA